MHDVFSLKLAIYFILPPVVLCASAYICAAVLTLISPLVVERDVSLNTAVHAMAFVIAITAGVAAMVYWTTQIFWVTNAAGVASFFFFGAIVYSGFLEDFSPRGSARPIAPIGLSKGSLLSAMISLCAVAFNFFVLWCVGK